MNDPQAIRVSFFKAPISNVRPFRNLTIKEVYNYIIGHEAESQTETLRSISDRLAARSYKAENFAYATFGGTFSRRSNNSLKESSGLLCIDFDHLYDFGSSPVYLKDSLLKDRYFETVLLFISPSGDGLKWIIEIPENCLGRDDFFSALEAYILSTYGVGIDPSGKDISRACFLPYDPEAYINPKYL